MKELTLTYNSDNQRMVFDEVVNNTVRMLLVQGGSGSGKTFIIMRAIFIRALTMPKSFHYLFKTDLGVLVAGFERNVISWLEEMKLQPIYRYDKARNILFLKNGAQIHLKPIKAPTPKQSKDNSLLGMEAETIYIDEATSLVYEWWEFFISRCRSARGYNSLMVASENPAKRTWSNNYFVKKINPVTLEDLPDVIKQQVKVLRIESWDNVFIETLFLDMLKNSGDADRFYYGRVNDAIDFDQIYTYEVGEFVERMFNVYGIDPGYSVPTGIVQIGFGGDYTVNVRQLYYEKGLTIEGYIKEVEKIIRIHESYRTCLQDALPIALKGRMLYIQTTPHIIIDSARTDLVKELDEHFNTDVLRSGGRRRKQIIQAEFIACNKDGGKLANIRKAQKLKQIVSPESNFYLKEIGGYLFQPSRTDAESVPDGEDHLLDAALYCMGYILELFDRHPYTLFYNNDLKTIAELQKKL